ncbi:hypothetical protein [Rhabdothermincola salaria]|uniref:hypothetical protein n=1 Tax=Rhabdothermincola salaria TaxID=2903142 RepID=UPI001E373763|nr:hypothetical protein [Rhabdothermincola salaria]MCD9624714.1 hypothetical protein [Rhabdothermincola salaria]
MRRRPHARLIRSGAAVVAVVVALGACDSSGREDDAGNGVGTRGSTPVSTATEAPTTTIVEPTAMDARSRLARRLALETQDPDAARTVAAELDQGVVDRLIEATDGDLEDSPVLGYTPDRAADEQIDSLWLFSWGFRIDPASGIAPVGLTDTPPPIESLRPGPVNRAIAEAAADFVERHPVPIVAQWEVARELDRLGVPDVISVEPITTPEGETVYLSTPGVIQEGQRLAAAAGVDPGRAGIITFDRLAVGSLLVADTLRLDAVVPEGVRLPVEYDPESGQLWTRSLEAWLPVDLLGRSYFAE